MLNHPALSDLGGTFTGKLHQQFSCCFPHSALAALNLFKPFFSKYVSDNKNYYGSVPGLNGPSDAFPIWNQWLGENRSHLAKELDEEVKTEMKQFFDAWRHISKKTFLNKNNRNSLCGPMLASVFDNVNFVEIHSNPVYVAHSLVFSRKEVQGSEKIGRGLLSSDTNTQKDPLGYIEDICKHVHKVDSVLAEARDTIDVNRYFRVSYEDFCKNPSEIVEQIASHILSVEVSSKKPRNLQFSTSANQQRLED